VTGIGVMPEVVGIDEVDVPDAFCPVPELHEAKISTADAANAPIRSMLAMDDSFTCAEGDRTLFPAEGESGEGGGGDGPDGQDHPGPIRNRRRG
jgi:hypothetical protein